MIQVQVFWRDLGGSPEISCLSCGETVLLKTGETVSHCGIDYVLRSELERGGKVRMNVRVKDGGQ